MSMDQIEGLEPIHENWGDVDLGEQAILRGGCPAVVLEPWSRTKPLGIFRHLPMLGQKKKDHYTRCILNASK